MKRIKLFIPLIIFFLFIPLFLLVMKKDRDPNNLPSVLLDRAFPDFALRTLDSEKIYGRADIIGEPFLINVWATWCPSCRYEHPYLVRLAKEQGVNIYGLDYRDEIEAAKRWVATLGDPYKLNFFDPEGSLVLDLGVYGAPETFFVDAQGFIRYRHVGVVNEQVWNTILKPLYYAGAAKTVSAEPGVSTSP